MADKEGIAVSASPEKSPDIPADKKEEVHIGSRISRPLWAAIGLVCFGLGAIGVVFPLIPTTPFMLLAAFCFARSSKRLNTWFMSTTLYERVLADYSKKRTMTVKSKLTILIPVTLLLGISFAVMANVPVGRIAVGIVWIAHVIYFGFIVKTDKGIQPDQGCSSLSQGTPSSRVDVE